MNRETKKYLIDMSIIIFIGIVAFLVWQRATNGAPAPFAKTERYKQSVYQGEWVLMWNGAHYDCTLSAGRDYTAIRDGERWIGFHQWNQITHTLTVWERYERLNLDEYTEWSVVLDNDRYGHITDGNYKGHWVSLTPKR